jgi:hypothetical protein
MKRDGPRIAGYSLPTGFVHGLFGCLLLVCGLDSLWKGCFPPRSAMWIQHTSYFSVRLLRDPLATLSIATGNKVFAKLFGSVQISVPLFRRHYSPHQTKNKTKLAVYKANTLGAR